MKIDAKELLLEHAAEVLGREEDHPSLPVVTPHTWHRRKCRCGTCDVCVWFARVESEGSDRGWAAWRKTHRAARHHTDPRWSSVQAVLELYVGMREEGYSSGSMGVTELQRLRTTVQRTRSPSPPKAVLVAEDMAEIEGALRRAIYDDPAEDVAVSTRTAILFCRVVGREEQVRSRGRTHRRRTAVPVDELAERHDMTRGKVGGIVQRGMRRLRADMAARGLVPMPPRGTRSHEAALRIMEGWDE